MRNQCFIILIVLLFNISASNYAQAEEPYQFAFIYPVQFVNERESIKGIRWNFIYGVNEDVSGLDFGVINQVNGTYYSF